MFVNFSLACNPISLQLFKLWVFVPEIVVMLFKLWVIVSQVLGFLASSFGLFNLKLQVDVPQVLFYYV